MNAKGGHCISSSGVVSRDPGFLLIHLIHKPSSGMQRMWKCNV